MIVRKLNVLDCELDDSLDQAGFRHTGESIGDRIGAQRIGAGPVEVQREPAAAPSRPVINALSVPVSDPAEEPPPGFRVRLAALRRALGGGGLGGTVVELDHDERSGPYQYGYGREKWLLILSGGPTLRHPQGEDVLRAGDVVCLPEGPGGAHQLINHGDHVARAVVLSTQGLPAHVCFPDSGTWTLRHHPDLPGVSVREG